VSSDESDVSSWPIADTPTDPPTPSRYSAHVDATNRRFLSAQQSEPITSGRDILDRALNYATDSETATYVPIVLLRLAGRVLARLHDQFGRAQGLTQADHPFDHADLVHTLEDLDRALLNDRLDDAMRREQIDEAMQSPLDRATGPGSWPDLDRAIVYALEHALYEVARYPSQRVAMIDD